MDSGTLCRDLIIPQTIILLLSVYLVFNLFNFCHLSFLMYKSISKNLTVNNIINILLYFSTISLLVLAINYYKNIHNIKPFTKNTSVNNLNSTASLVLSIINFLGMVYFLPNFLPIEFRKFIRDIEFHYYMFNVILCVLIIILFSIEVYRNDRRPLSSSNNATFPPPQLTTISGTTPPVYSSGFFG